MGAKKYLLQFRALSVFRDESDFSGFASLKSKIESGLDNSEYLILLASPKIASSSTEEKINWIEEEVKYWIKSKHPKEWDTNSQIEDLKIIICLTDGVINWDYAKTDFDWENTNALPPILKNRFQDEPQWIDFTDINLTKQPAKDNFSVENPKFKQKVAEVSSQIQNVPVDLIIGNDIKRKRLWNLILILAIIILLASVGAILLLQQRSIKNLELANANHLATLAIQVSSRNPTEALAIAKEAFNRAPQSQAEKALAHCFYEPVNRRELLYSKKIQMEDILRHLQFLGNTTDFICNVQGEPTIKIFNINGEIFKSKKLQGPIIQMTASNDGKLIAATSGKETEYASTTSGEFYLWNIERDTIMKRECSIANNLNNNMVFSDDDHRVAWNSENKLFLFDTQNNSLDSIELAHPIKGFLFLKEHPSILIVSGWLLEESFKIETYDFSLEPMTEFRPQGELLNFDLSYDQKLLCYTDRDSTSLLSIPELNPIRQWSNEHNLSSVKFLPNGNLVKHDGSIVIYDTLGISLYSENIDGPSYFLNVSPKGNYLLHGDFKGTVLIKSLNGKTLAKVGEQATVFNGILDKSERFLVTGNDIGDLHIYAFNQYRPPALVVDTANYDAINDIVYRASSQEILTISSEGNVSSWNLDGEKLKTVNIDDELSKAIVIDMNQKLLVGGGEGIYFVDLKSMKIDTTKTIPTESEILGIAKNKNGNKWVATNSSGQIATNYWGSDTLIQIAGDDYIWDADFSEDETKLFICSGDSNLYILSLNEPSDYRESINFGSPVIKLTSLESRTLIQTEDNLWISEGDFSSEKLRKIATVSRENEMITDAQLLNDGSIIYTEQEGINVHKINNDGTSLVSKAIFNYPYKLITPIEQNYIAILTLEGNVFLMNSNLELIYKYSFPEYSDTASSGFFKDDGTEIIIASWAGLATIWKTPNGIEDFLNENPNTYYKLTSDEKTSYGISK